MILDAVLEFVLEDLAERGQIGLVQDDGEDDRPVGMAGIDDDFLGDRDLEVVVMRGPLDERGDLVLGLAANPVGHQEHAAGAEDRG